MRRAKPTVPETDKAEAFARIQAAMPKGWKAERDPAREALNPAELCVRLHVGRTETRDWEWDLTKPLTDTVLAGFKRTAEHDREGSVLTK